MAFKFKLKPPKVRVPAKGLPGKTIPTPPRALLKTNSPLKSGTKIDPKELKKLEKLKKAEIKKIKNAKNPAELKKLVGNKKLKGKSLDQVASQPDVITAAAKNQGKLKKLGMAGLGAAGLAALMINYGTLNPVEAIEKALADAAETAADTGSSIFTNLFSSFRGAMGVSSLCCFIIFVLVITWLIGSAMLS